MDSANKQLSLLLELSRRLENSELLLQIMVLQAKVKVEILNSKFETAESTLNQMKLLMTDEKRFQLVSQAKRSNAHVEYLRAEYYMTLMR